MNITILTVNIIKVTGKRKIVIKIFLVLSNLIHFISFNVLVRPKTLLFYYFTLNATVIKVVALLKVVKHSISPT